MKKSEARKDYSELSNKQIILYDKLNDAKFVGDTAAIENIADEYQSVLFRAMFVISTLILTGVEDEK